MEKELEEGYMNNNRNIGKINKDINWEEKTNNFRVT